MAIHLDFRLCRGQVAELVVIADLRGRNLLVYFCIMLFTGRLIICVVIIPSITLTHVEVRLMSQ